MSNIREQQISANLMTAKVHFRGAESQFIADRLDSLDLNGQRSFAGVHGNIEVDGSRISLSFPAHQAVSGQRFKIGEDKNVRASFETIDGVIKATSGEVEIVGWNPVSGMLNMAFSFEAEEVKVTSGEVSFTIESGNLGSRVEATITPAALPMGNLIADQISLTCIDDDGYLLSATQMEGNSAQGLRMFIYPSDPIAIYRPLFIIDSGLVDLQGVTGDFVWDEQAGTLSGSFKDGVFVYKGKEHVVASTSFSVTLDR
ncbi:hypothetical protein ACIPZ5_02690 [Pseudomonas sp. NPDC089428]|uniref:hypothetical protein n=1 Tax=Pseudomonas sp. NPDC089428 TaxID=3364467 RepID=UPI00382CA589